MQPVRFPARLLRAVLCALPLFLSAIDAQPTYGKCTEKNIEVRKEWSTLTTPERTDYIKSVKCLMKKTALTPKEAAPGVLTRYDDFTALHINNTIYIHTNGAFLTWHRHFLNLYQKALREECGFKGTLPYWNWAWWSDDLACNPIFDGSKTSMGGDGFHNESAALAKFHNITYPRANGGGCISKGPFTNLTLPFHAFKTEELFLQTTPSNALISAPRCVTRDLNSAISGPHMNQAVIDGLLSAPTIKDFQEILDKGLDKKSLGPHPAGHFAVGWGLQDQYASPADPTFFLHHGMVDNAWEQWQVKDLKNRRFALDGTNRTANAQPSVPVTVDYVLDFGYLGASHKMGDLMDTRAGVNCYRYEYEQGAPQPS
ncbi:Di-copper centre-containing protein [Byssothecium circinans]|uniref:Di-copper centre-containing protein n=1 Tax=Byssothecium circinans TaxID=147558 RepID=A0A6A5UG02_9PLEO|nr:Di-copper centre-containing protein [Byssothecium circinans]